MKYRTHCLSAGVLAASAVLVVGALVGVQNSAALDSSSSQSPKILTNVTTAGPQVWSEVSTPDQGSNANALIGVACLGSSCTAVGFYTNASGVDQTLVETWNGTGWSLVSSPNTGSGDNELRSISCLSAASCTAVGWYVDASGNDQALTESWNGTEWSIVSSPDTAMNDFLYGVSCDSGGCVAVGDDVDGSNLKHTLIETFDGTAWTLAASPDNGSLNNVLNGVTCMSAQNCIAVGSYLDGSAHDTDESLIESFDGTSWSISPSPVGLPGDDYNLQSISCSTASNCSAVGQPAGLIESWNGSSWSVVKYHGGSNSLFGVYCQSSTACAAVGVDFTDPLFQSWNGISWSKTTGQHVESDDFMSSVACLSATSCIAVGNAIAGNGPMQTLAELGSIPGPPSPTITSFSPTSGPPGTTVVIRGTNFPSASSVTFGAVAGTITVDDPTKIKAMVPNGAITGRIRVTVPGGTVTSSTKFKVT
jgi:IPT/TIG domain-containing protein